MKSKILLVDDKPEFSQLVKTFLSRNYDVELAGNGFLAISKLQSGYLPDLIVSDINMPVVDGKTLIRQLQASAVFRHIPVIVVSTIDKSAERIELLKTGASDFIIKPFNPEELEIRIEKLLNRTVVNNS